MGQRPVDSVLVESILRGPRGVIVLHGPARSGKTAAALDLYERYAADAGRPACLLLAPDTLAKNFLHDELLQRSGCGAAVAPSLMTLAELAGQILLAARLGHKPLSTIGRRTVLASLLAELVGAHRLPILARLLDAPGLVVTVDQAIGDLKRSGQKHSGAAEQKGWRGEVLTVYQQYQAYLAEHQFYDESDPYTLALEHLAKTDVDFLKHTRAAVADGFTEFTHGQLALLQFLATRLERLVITLPLANDNRPELWQWPTRQLQRLRRTFGDALTQVAVSPAKQRPGLVALADRLFDGRDERLEPPEELSFVAASGMESECRAIARWAKTHLAAGAQARDLLIMARHAAPYEPVLARVFAEAGLPAVAMNQPLQSVPLARLLMALLRAADGLAFDDVLTVLSSSYFNPAALGDFAADVPLAAQLLVRHGNVLEGAQQYARAAAWLTQRVQRLEDRQEDDEFASPMDEQLARVGAAGLAQAGKLLEALFERLAPISAGGTLAELAAATQSLLAALKLTLPRQIDLLAADLRALAAIDAVLMELAAVPGLTLKLSAGAFADRLWAAMAETSVASACPTGAIAAAAVTDARAVSAKHVWLAGLNEGAFPVPVSPGPLQDHAESFLPDLAARELLLFYLSVSRAAESLCLSWLCDDGDGRDMAPSPLAAEFARPLGGLENRVATLPTAQFAPPPQEVTNQRECLNLALSAVADRQDGAAADLAALGQVARRWPDELARLSFPLWATHRRWSRDQSDAYDGVLDEQAVLAELARRAGETAVFSVSQINTYLTCPWRYFAQRVLKLVELPEPQEALLPRQRGILVHDVLRRVMARLIGTPAAQRSDWAGPQARHAVEESIAEQRAAGPAGQTAAALWQIELDQIKSILLAYLDRQSTLPLPAGLVRYAEVGFGMGKTRDSDAASMPEPFQLEAAGRKILLRGKIDRLDILSGPDGGQRLFVVDYKTGELPKPQEDVQLPVYIAAAAQLTGLAPAGGAFHGLRAGRLQDRYLADFSVRGRSLAANGDFQAQLDHGLELVSLAVAGIAAGSFDIFVQARCPQESCPYRRICGHSEPRGLYKPRPAREEVAHD
jgi:ATP-dependent helicase/nuclease subunit B